MKQKIMKPQDLMLLLKIISIEGIKWNQIDMALALGLSQSEVSESISRLKFSKLLNPTGKSVMKKTLYEFLQYGLACVFPIKPGAITKGILTSHSAPPLNKIITSSENFVWPYYKGKDRGQAILPLYSTIPEAVLKDKKFYELMALTDALRVGKAREKNIALQELKERFKIEK